MRTVKCYYVYLRLYYQTNDIEIAMESHVQSTDSLRLPKVYETIFSVKDAVYIHKLWHKILQN